MCEGHIPHITKTIPEVGGYILIFIAFTTTLITFKPHYFVLLSKQMVPKMIFTNFG